MYGPVQGFLFGVILISILLGPPLGSAETTGHFLSLRSEALRPAVSGWLSWPLELGSSSCPSLLSPPSGVGLCL